MANMSLLDKDNPKVYAYAREMDGQKILVLLNFSASDATTHLELNLANAKMLLSNYNNNPATGQNQSTIILKPYQTIIYKL